MLSNTIQSARESIGLNQKQFAELVDTHPTRLSRIESGKEMLAWHQIPVYSRVLKVPQRVLVEGIAQTLLIRAGTHYRVKIKSGRAPRNPAGLIKEERLRRGYSLLSAATALGVSRPRIAEIERGTKALRVSSAVRLADALRLPRKRLVQLALQTMINQKCGGTYIVQLA